MSLKELNKEQKQYIVLGLLAAVILGILATLGVKSSLSTIAAAKMDLAELTEKIEKADRSLSRREHTNEEYQRTVASLRNYIETAPPERNYYSWANEVIYSCGRAVGLEIDSIDEISLPQAKSTDKPGEEIKFEAYTLRITAHGGYENTKIFLKLIKADYPLARFTGIEISSGSVPESHNVQLFMQWPFNLGEMGKNWDAVESSQGAAAKSDPVPVQTPEPAPKREPHPPVSKPEAVVVPSVPKTDPVIDRQPEAMPESTQTIRFPEETKPVKTSDESIVQPDVEMEAEQEPVLPTRIDEGLDETAEGGDAPEGFDMDPAVQSPEPIPEIEPAIEELVPEVEPTDETPVQAGVEASDPDEGIPEMDGDIGTNAKQPEESSWEDEQSADPRMRSILDDLKEELNDDYWKQFI